MALYHVYSQTVADGTATSVVRPSDWNSAHSQVMTLAGNTAGASTISGTNLVFQGGNNVTLSANQGANVGTLVVSAANQSVQTQASGNIVGAGYTSTTQAGSTVGVTQNSNGLSAAWPPYITTYANSYNVVQMGTGTVDGGGTSGATFSSGAGTVFLQAGNNMTLSQTSNTINISGADVKWQFVGANTAGTTSSNLSANQFYFSGGNNVTLSGNSNTIVISAAAGGGGGVTAKSLMIPQPHLLTTVGSLGTASASVQFIEHPGPLTWTAINIPMSVSVATTNNSSFAGQNFSVTYIVATQTGQTLNSVVSTTWSAFQAWQSNSTASVTGGRVLSTTWGSSLPGGEYYHILRINTANTGGGLTGVGGGTATTALGNTCSIMGAASAVFGAVTWGALGAATASSNGPWLQGGHGLNSSTGQLTNMSMSNISKVGTFGQRALFGAIFLG